MNDEAAPKAKGKTGKWWKIGGGLLAGLIVLVAITPAPEQDSSSAAAEPAAAPPVEVTAQQLFAAFEANEAAAQQTYGGKTLAVSGVVQGVTLDFMDNPVIQLATSNQFLSVSASGVDTATAAAVEKGSRVTVLCDDVGEVIGSPQLEGCRIAP